MTDTLVIRPRNNSVKIAQRIVAGVTGPATSTSGNIATFGSSDGTVLTDSGVPSTRVPSAGEKLALVGTSGTPGSANKFVTNDDSRMSDARTPTTHTHAASEVVSGTFAAARLGSGTANSSTYLRGDGTWATPSGSGDFVGPGSSTDNAVLRFDGLTGKLGQNSAVTIDDSGNIATSGTVDGRDVSVDGAKLDGIESGADVTDATNVAAAGAVMTSAIGVSVQAYDADLAALAGLTSAADKLPYFTGAGTADVADFTAAGRAVVGAANAAAQRTALGLVIGTNVQAYDAELAALAGLTSAADKLPYFTGAGTAGVADFTAAGRAIAGAADASAQRTALGLGTAALSATGDFAAASHTHAAGDITSGTIATARLGSGTANSTVFLRGDQTWAAPAGGGDVVGPASSTDEAIARFDLTTGKLLQNSAVTIDDSGNIATSGTVDGRDVSVDGAKLDGIESGADVTDATNVAAAGAVMTSAIGVSVQAYDADLAALAGLTSAADKVPYFTGAGTAAVADFTAAGRAVAGAADASAQRTALGLVIGTNVQAYDADLAALAGLTSAADKLPYFTGAGTADVADFTAAGRAVVGAANAAAQRTALGLVIGTDVQAYDAELAALAGLTSAADRVPYFTGSGAAALATFTSFGRTLASSANAAAALSSIGAVGAVSSTDNAIARFDSTAGQIQNSNVTIADTGAVTIAAPTGAGSAAGLTVTGGASNGHAIVATGDGTGEGGVFVGGDNSGDGVTATGGATNGYGVVGYGTGSGTGGYFTGGGTNSYGAVGVGGTTNGGGLLGQGTGTGNGVVGIVTGTGYAVVASGDTTTPTRSSLRVVPQDTAPSTAIAGDVYFNSGTGRFYTHNGTAWQADGNMDGDKGDVTVSSAGTVWTIDANVVSDTKLRQGAALSVIGNATNSTANVADIAAASDHQVLRRSGTAIAFGAVNLAQSAAVTGTLAVGNGGTGATTFTADAILKGNTTSAVAASGVSIDSSNAISGHLAKQNVQTGTTYTVVAGDTGKHLIFTNASAVTVTIPETLLAGFQCSWEQRGAGKVSFNGSAVTAATLNCRSSGHVASAGQYGVGGISVYTGAGSAAVATLFGDTGT